MLKITNLTANFEKNPIGLTEPPVLHWQADGGFKPKYFRIKIYSYNMEEIREFTVENNFYFDCGNIRLQPFCRYFWNVEAECETTVVSETAEFVTSVLNRSQWTADVFRNFECLRAMSERKIFAVDGGVKKAYIFIASSGEKSNGYHAYINGMRISDDLLMPGPMENMSMRVRGYDITEMLKDKNVINVDHVSAISAVIKIFTADGVQTIQTDKSWEVYPGEMPFAVGYENSYTPTRHHGKYERFDASKRNSDWYNAECAFECTARAPVHGWGPIKLRYLQTTAKAFQTLAPVAVVKNNEGFLVDFGKIQSGCVKIIMHNQRNMVVIRYAERAADGKICTSQYANQYLPVNEYIPVGLAEEKYAPYFMHTSFRYVQISGYDGELSENDITALFIHSDVEENSLFKTDDARLDYVFKSIQRSYKSNLIHIPTDCPGRERRGWTGDSFAVVQSQCFMYNVYNIYDRWFEDLHDNQRMNGWCSVEYPDQTDPCIDINWPMHIVIVPWTVYKHYGNIKILKKNIDCMEKYCELLYEMSDGFLFAENLFMYGDWVAEDRASADFIGSALFCYVNKLLSLAETALGREDLAEKYGARAEEIKQAVNVRYLVCDNDTAYYDNNSQSANTLALAFDICPADKADAVLKSLVDDVTEKNAVTVGYIANTWFFEVLSRYGKDGLAYRLITDSGVRNSIAAMVNQLKNETLNESFSDIDNSLNHAFLGGGAANWIYGCFAGIKIIKPGYEEFAVKPYFSKQTDNFDLSLNTPFGMLRIAWRRLGKTIRIKVTSPVSKKGTLVLKTGTHTLEYGINEFEFDE